MITPPIVIPSQVQPAPGVQPYSNQSNFGQLQGEIAAYAPHALPQLPVWINDCLWKLLDMKTWYGTWTKGQIVCPQAVTGGTATVTLGSNQITGTNTSWSTNLVGRQFRVGLNNPIYTITAVDVGTQTLTIELPWGGPLPPGATTQTTGYNIVQMYYNLGPNVKYIKTVINVQMGFRLKLNLTQDWLNLKDPWRIWTNFPVGIAPLPADPNGNYIVEMWPAPYTQQSLPVTLYTQWPKLQNDNDCLPPYMRSDVVAEQVTARALRYRPKENPAYDPQTALAIAADFDKKFYADLEAMWNADENLYRTSSTIEGEDYPEWNPGGDLWAAQHAVSVGGGDDGW